MTIEIIGNANTIEIASQGQQGIAGVNWQGNYSGATAYKINDGVLYNGSSYRCILASTGNLPTNDTYWFIIALAATPVVKPVITGSRGGNAALSSLLTALATLEMITDSSTV